MTALQALAEYDGLLVDERIDAVDEALFDEYASELRKIRLILFREFFVGMHGLPEPIAEKCINNYWDMSDEEFMIEYVREAIS
ncbi:hypothetical protein ACFFIS_04795 [Virgibacillus soli]|uniref:Uncharacterized protein n=1 Tax=Paracerasibacillus soli TaxID=480284 RepID=A0ABU5CUN9_9BACI|nr:hypothetical protein [Virgibacillus soli]MDY0409955.1 hypothetical protein [Virgibacillus soli]